MPEGLLIIRAVLGLLLFAHGTQKLFGWYQGHGLDGTGAMFEQIGHRPGRQMARVAGMSEAGGGLLLTLGLIAPLGAAMVMGTMLVAAVSVHAPQGLWNTNGGYELPLVYATTACGLGFTGAGGWSIDHAAGIPWTSGAGPGCLAIVLALVTGGITLARRTRVLEADASYPAEPQPATDQSVSDETAAGARR